MTFSTSTPMDLMRDITPNGENSAEKDDCSYALRGRRRSGVFPLLCPFLPPLLPYNLFIFVPTPLTLFLKLNTLAFFSIYLKCRIPYKKRKGADNVLLETQATKPKLAAQLEKTVGQVGRRSTARN